MTTKTANDMKSEILTAFSEWEKNANDVDLFRKRLETKEALDIDIAFYITVRITDSLTNADEYSEKFYALMKTMAANFPDEYQVLETLLTAEMDAR